MGKLDEDGTKREKLDVDGTKRRKLDVNGTKKGKLDMNGTKKGKPDVAFFHSRSRLLPGISGNVCSTLN